MPSDTPQPPTQQDLLISPLVSLIKIIDSAPGRISTGVVILLIVWFAMMKPLLIQANAQAAVDQQLHVDLLASLSDAKESRDQLRALVSEARETVNHMHTTAILLDRLVSDKIK